MRSCAHYWSRSFFWRGVFILAAWKASAADLPIGPLAVAVNADGRLELFASDADGGLRHRWQRESLHDWSAWSSLGGHLCPGAAVVQDKMGRLWVFAVDQSSRRVESCFQTSSNSLNWSAWSKLSGQAVQPPVAAELGPDGQLHVFGVGAGGHSLKHTWQLENEGGWSEWSDLGGTLGPGPVVTRSQTGQLEVFCLNQTDNTLVHCWQTDREAPDKWSAWSDLGARVLPGFEVGLNADGRLEVFGVSAVDSCVGHSFQLAAGLPMGWSPWYSLDAKMKPEVAWGRNRDGRIEIFAVSPTNDRIFHSIQAKADATTNWSIWTDMSLSGALTRSRPAVGRNLEGWLELFSLDEKLDNVVNHCCQIAGNLEWTDWSSLNRLTMQYLTREWHLDDGLTDNRVQAIAQTGEGYIWVGTRNGLRRFDGVRFEALDLNPVFGKPNVSITCLLTDRNGALWIGSEQAGLARMAGGQLTHFGRTNGLAGESVTAICEGKDSSLWIGTTNGLSHYQEGAFVNLTSRDGLLPGPVRSIAEDSEGSLWVTTRNGLSHVQGNTINNFTQMNGLPDNSVRGIWQDVPGRLWIGSNRGLLLYRNSKFYAYTRNFGLPDRLVNVVRSDRQGNVWVGTGSGLYRFQDGTFLEELGAGGISLGTINAVFEDREGNLWAGSQNGLFRLTPKKLLLYNKQLGLTHANVTTVLEDVSGSLWIGTAGGGLDRLRNQAITAFAPGATNSIDQVLSLCAGRDGSLWVGGDYGGGLTHFQEGEATHYARREGLPGGTVRVIHEDRAGHVWFGTGFGLSCLQAGRFVTNAIITHLADENVRAICEDKQGSLWFGTDDGLSRWQDGHATRFTTHHGLSANRITALYQDEDQTLWIGTESSGLNRYESATGRFVSYGTQQGLFSDEILEILADDIGWLWMTSPQGVFRVRKADFALVDSKRLKAVNCIAYGRDDGLESVSCGAGKPGGWKTRDGELWFPTGQGVVAIDPRIININLTPPTVHIEKLMANAKPLALPATAGAPVRIPPGRNELEFHYTAPSFQKPERIRFKYKLEGVNPDWIDADTRRTAYYNNLSPGHYSFHVRACNSDGVWNERGASLAVILLPYFWQTRLFLSLAGLGLALSIASVARYATKRKMERQLQQVKQQHAVELERTRIARDMHDELGAKLTRISFQGAMARRRLDDAPEAAQHVEKMAQTARELVSSLDEIVWAVDPKNDSLDDLATYVCRYASAFFEDSPIHCKFVIPARLPDCRLTTDVRHNLFLAVKEALNNVLKHSGASRVEIQIKVGGGTFEIRISDNGGGMAPTEGLKTERVGHGLVNLNERLGAIQGRCEITSSPGQGTSVRLIVPLATASRFDRVILLSD
jgi:ligand-binding sensor domain-containing protein/signal transduction histidine kinase